MHFVVVFIAETRGRGSVNSV